MKEATAMRHSIHALATALLAAALAGGCGEDIVPVEDPGLSGSGVNLAAVPPSAYPLPGANDAARFLNQATFGANDADIAKTESASRSIAR